MPYTPLGLGGIIVAALRHVVITPELQAQIDQSTADNASQFANDETQAAAIAAVQTNFAELGTRLSALESDDALNDEARETIAQTLGIFGPAAKAAIPALSKELQSPNASLRNQVQRALAEIDPKH